jgi:GAF domain-containing protein
LIKPVVILLNLFARQAAIAVEDARLFSEVQRLAITDPLTGLFNRRHFFEAAEQEFGQFITY